MPPQTPATALQLISTVRRDAKLELSLASFDVPEPGPDQVLIRVEAAPINPSDMGLLFGFADMRTAAAEWQRRSARRHGRHPRAIHARHGGAPRPGHAGGQRRRRHRGEGGLVAGRPGAARKDGRCVGGGMYAQYRCMPSSRSACGCRRERRPAKAPSWFVNPLTALGMVETMKAEGHKALVHTAAASNLGQMLNKLCIADGVPLVNIVRRPEQVEILKRLGAKCICDSSEPTFKADLDRRRQSRRARRSRSTRRAAASSRARSCSAMEIAANTSATEFSRYGSTTHKQVYIYGGLDRSPTELDAQLRHGLGRSAAGSSRRSCRRTAQRRARSCAIASRAEIKTIFASHYTKSGVARRSALSPSRIAVVRQAGDRGEVPDQPERVSKRPSRARTLARVSSGRPGR